MDLPVHVLVCPAHDEDVVLASNEQKEADDDRGQVIGDHVLSDGADRMKRPSWQRQLVRRVPTLQFKEYSNFPIGPN